MKISKKNLVKVKGRVIPDPTETLAEDLDWNDEIIEDVSAEGESDLVVYSRDWTIATIIRSSRKILISIQNFSVATYGTTQDVVS